VATVFEGDKRKAQREKTIYNLERLTPDDQKSGLSIEDIDFIVRNVSGDSVTIQSDLYISNNGLKPSGPFDIEVKAKEMDAHIVAAKQTVPVANIDPEKILVVPVRLTVPDQYNYVMEVLVWKNETIIKRMEGTVQLRPGTTIPDGDQFVTKKIETSKFISSQSTVSGGAALPYSPVPSQAPGFGVSVALVAMVTAGAYIIGQRRQK
jgi:PGF-CTERM protein